MSLTHATFLFAAAAAMVTWAGVQLSRAGDEIAERAGLSRLLVGMVLVAGATSLPEIVTDVSAAVAHAPDLAVGDLFGSSMANMAILAVIDLVHRHRGWPRVEIGHARVASVAVSLTALATLAILTPPGLTIGWVGLDTIAIVAAYVAAVAWMRRSPYSGRTIAVATGVGETFVGTTLLALSTSLPELVASVAAVRIGAHNLAVGNLFGSNAFNMAALVLVDAAYRPAALLRSVDPSQAVAGVGAILLMALALAALVHGTETRARRLEPDAILLLIVYAGALVAVWSVRP